MQPITIFFTGLLTVLLFSATVAATESETSPDMLPPRYQLSLSFAPDKHQLIATAMIEVPAGQRLHLNLTGLTFTGGLLRADNGAENELCDIRDMFILPPAQTNRTIYLSYTAQFEGHSDNIISPGFMPLGGLWDPPPNIPMRFSVTSNVPAEFSVITESDLFPLDRVKDEFRASFSKPVTNIHFIAAPFDMQKLEIRKGLSVFTAFFHEDKALAPGYLNAAKQFILRYEKEIDTFPYNHFVIVANRLPTGYSMPTMTLIGQMVLRLPFIKSISLGHEIVHSWFGNEVEVDSQDGNWCEGLTAFLADHAYRAEKGEAANDRKETIIKYLSYVHGEAALPLNQFRSASHNQPMADARRAVGYDRGAMFFNELRYLLGEDQFSRGIKQFYQRKRGSAASWNDIQKSFEDVSGRDLQQFFTNRLSRSDIPDIDLEQVDVLSKEDGFSLQFQLRQKTKPFDLVIPVAIKTMTGTLARNIAAQNELTTVSLNLDERPLSITLDPDYQLMRQLQQSEMTPVWSRFLGSAQRLVVTGQPTSLETYNPILTTLNISPASVRTETDISEEDLSKNDILFLGTESRILKHIFGRVVVPENQFSLLVRMNPLNPDKVAVILQADNTAQSKQMAARLSHYGKYSSLSFQDGQITEKTISDTQMGIQWQLEILPVAGVTASLSSFDEIIRALDTTQVIYVGETHTSVADHRLQLRVIEALYQRNPRLAIGMEMFPVSSQAALDAYTLADPGIDERSFLKQSDYFEVWRYDYRFFRDIMNFARKHSIPVRGLNLNRDIVSSVFKEGSIEKLGDQIRKTLPAERDLSLAGYGEQLRMMFGMHMEGGHGSGSVNGFIQAQVLWDETMAENIVAFLQENPDYRMVILAGSQHTRKDFGIPPRVARRLEVNQASLLNAYNSSQSNALAQVADYYFLADPLELPELPKMGVVLSGEELEGRKVLKITELSPHSKAKEADLRPGDILAAINGVVINDMADVRIAMLDAKAGDELEIKILRKQDEVWKEETKSVTLTTPPSQGVHP